MVQSFSKHKIASLLIPNLLFTLFLNQRIHISFLFSKHKPFTTHIRDKKRIKSIQLLSYTTKKTSFMNGAYKILVHHLNNFCTVHNFRQFTRSFVIVYTFLSLCNCNKTWQVVRYQHDHYQLISLFITITTALNNLSNVCVCLCIGIVVSCSKI